MKFRTDFVTNSSSSSFCVALYAEDENGKKICMMSYLNDLEEEYPDIYELGLHRLIGEGESAFQKEIQKVQKILIDLALGKTPKGDQKLIQTICDYLQFNNVEPNTIVKIIKEDGVCGNDSESINLNRYLDWEDVKEGCDLEEVAKNHNTDTKSIQLYINFLNDQMKFLSLTDRIIYEIFTGKTIHEYKLTDDYCSGQPDMSMTVHEPDPEDGEW